MHMPFIRLSEDQLGTSLPCYELADQFCAILNGEEPEGYVKLSDADGESQAALFMQFMEGFRRGQASRVSSPLDDGRASAHTKTLKEPKNALEGQGRASAGIVECTAELSKFIKECDGCDAYSTSYLELIIAKHCVSKQEYERVGDINGDTYRALVDRTKEADFNKRLSDKHLEASEAYMNQVDGLRKAYIDERHRFETARADVQMLSDRLAKIHAQSQP